MRERYETSLGDDLYVISYFRDNSVNEFIIMRLYGSNFKDIGGLFSMVAYDVKNDKIVDDILCFDKQSYLQDEYSIDYRILGEDSDGILVIARNEEVTTSRIRKLEEELKEIARNVLVEMLLV